MNVTIRVPVDTDLDTLAKILTLSQLPATPRMSQVRAEVTALLAENGLYGCLRRYHRPCASSPATRSANISSGCTGAGLSPRRHSHHLGRGADHRGPPRSAGP